MASPTREDGELPAGEELRDAAVQLRALLEQYVKSECGNTQIFCPCSLRGLNILNKIAWAKTGTPAKFRHLAGAFGWPRDPALECGDDGFEGLTVACTYSAQKLDALSQHANAQSGQSNGLENLVRELAELEEDDEANEADVAQAKNKLAHRVLAEALQPVTRVPEPQARIVPKQQQLDEIIPWPPLLLVEGIGDRDHWGTQKNHLNQQAINSDAKLKRRFLAWEPLLAAAQYSPGFHGTAVLGFAGSAAGLQLAKNLREAANSPATSEPADKTQRIASARWVCEEDLIRWNGGAAWATENVAGGVNQSGKPAVWAKGVLRWARQLPSSSCGATTSSRLAFVNKHQLEQQLQAEAREREEERQREVQAARETTAQAKQSIVDCQKELAQMAGAHSALMDKMRQETLTHAMQFQCRVGEEQERELAAARREARQEASREADAKVAAQKAQREAAEADFKRLEKERKESMAKTIQGILKDSEASVRENRDQKEEAQEKLQVALRQLKELQAKMEQGDRERELHESRQAQQEVSELHAKKAALEKQNKVLEEDLEDMNKMYNVMMTREMPPLRDLHNFVDKQLLASKDEGGFYDVLEASHRVRELGALDVRYMQSLELLEDDLMRAYAWVQIIAEPQTGAACEEARFTRQNPFVPHMAFPQGGSEVNWDYPWLIDFIKKYKKKRTEQVARQLIEYIRTIYHECLNSEKPATGFQKIVSKVCCSWSCNRDGYCTADSPLLREGEWVEGKRTVLREAKGAWESVEEGTGVWWQKKAVSNSELASRGHPPGWFKDGWLAPRGEVEMTPVEKLRLLRGLEQNYYERYTDEEVCGSCAA